MEYQELWNTVLEKLRHNLTEQSFNQTFQDVTKVVEGEGGLVYVICPSTFIQHNINNVYYRNIENIVNNLKLDKKIKLKFITEDALPKAPQPKQTFQKLNSNDLLMNYTFESFVTGDSNRVAFLTACKVAENPGNFVNPLYIFGGVGLGKTHLMQAVGNYISDYDVSKKIVYVQANDYLSDYMRANRDNNLKAFEEKYDNTDVLLVDDIQMLSDKNGTQQQFFKLFNELINKNKQIVITSDVPANRLNGFMDRLTSRFLCGVSVNINQPDFNQRVNILKRKIAEKTQKKIPEDVIAFIAETFTDNVRELEGALNRVIIFSDFDNKEITLESAKSALYELIKNKAPQNNPYENCISVVASMYGVQVVDILGSSRNAKVVLPRHITMYILKTKYNLTYAKIGLLLNDRHYSTIINGCEKMEAELKINPELKLAIEAILKKL
ncbi:MAG: chromosomal replication initiator protein DnaA [Acholeplasmatales bacterium]|nr:chromosomal replication initiator protein DnaA [Acholeplasmatales bacterium]